MLWFEQLQEASFRGVSIQVDSVRQQWGRQVVIKEYPFSDIPSFHDTGLKTHRFSLDFYVVGDDWLQQKDKLIEALNQPGTGKLITPWDGVVDVLVEGGFECEDSKDTGRITRFRASFVRATERRYPRTQVNRTRLAQDKITVAKTATAQNFSERFSVAGQPSWVWDRANDSLKGALTTVQSTFNNRSGNENIVFDFLDAGEEIGANLNTLINTPGQTGKGYVDLMGKGARVGNNFSSAFNSLGSLFGFKSSTSVNSGAVYSTVATSTATTTPTPARQQEVANNAAVENLVQTSAVLTASELLIEEANNSSMQGAALVSSEQSTAKVLTRPELDDMTRALSAGYEQVLAETEDAATYNALTDSYAATLAAVEDIKPDAQLVGQHQVKATVPARVLSYELYGTGEYADEIVTNNDNISNPLFVPGGETITVIKREAKV